MDALIGVLIGGVISILTGFFHGMGENERLKKSLEAQRTAAREERNFQAKKDAYVDAIAYFSETTIKYSLGVRGHELDELERSAPIIAAATLFSTNEIGTILSKIAATFKEGGRDHTPALALMNEAIALMKADLGLD